MSSSRIDTDLLVNLLRRQGHEVGHVIPVPQNAGEFEFEVDGSLYTLAEARMLAEHPPATAEPR